MRKGGDETMTKFSKVFVFSALMIAISVPAMAGDAARGKQLSEPCAACHGPDGNSPSPAFPNIAGQLPEYLYRSLLDYKNGNRVNAIMAGQVENLSRQDMRDLSAFYGSQKGLYLKR
jgi:cytochrome c553